MEKSPIWKHFAKRETGLVCSVCGMILTSGSGRFLAANLEKHLRTMHAKSDAFASFQREKTEWTSRRPRQSVAHKIALPVERKPRTVITSEEERRDRRRKMCREAQRRHRQRLRMLRETPESLGSSNAEKDKHLTLDSIPDLAPASDSNRVEINSGATTASVIDGVDVSETKKNALDLKKRETEHKSNLGDSSEATRSTNPAIPVSNTISTDLSTISRCLSLDNGIPSLHGSDIDSVANNQVEGTPSGASRECFGCLTRDYPTGLITNSSSILTTSERPSINDHNCVVGRVGSGSTEATATCSPSGVAVCGAFPPSANAATACHSIVPAFSSQQPTVLHPTLFLPVWNLFNFGHLPSGAVVDGPGIRSESLKNCVESDIKVPGHYSNGLLQGEHDVQQSSNCDNSPTTSGAVGKLKNFNIESLLS